MKKILGLCAVFVAGPTLSFAVKIGDTFSSVIAEKGNPTGTMESGGAQVLRYADLTVKLSNGKVTAVEAPTARPTTVATVVAATTSTAATAKPKADAAGAIWTTDYKAAMARAKEENRHVFLFFTGSDWCSWCMRLQKEILTTPEFARYAGEKLVLVELDFPKSKPQPQAVKAQNATLAKKYRIEGYPSVVVLDSAGKQVGELGYQEGGPRPFIEQLQKM